MTNKKRTAGFILVFSFLFLCRQVSYGQPGSVRDTAYEVLSEDCCGGSVPDTADAMYVAAIYSNPGKGPKSQIIFYRFYCRICCYLLRSRNGKQQPLPEADRVKDPALIKKLRNTLQKQLAYKTKLVNGIKY
jgi:hypothetical protein